jgi:hypothetical protein
MKETMLLRFNLMPVRDKKPLVAWKHLTEYLQTIQEREKVINENGKGTIGIVCGPVSKLFVLDDDGSEELKKYHIPRTATVKTPRGGKHHYFKWTTALDSKVTTRTAILDKVDTRGHGGYVVWYGWEQPPNIVPFAEPPQWLIDRLPNKTGTTVIGKPTTAEVLANVSEANHNRNASFTSLAGGLRNRGYGVEAIFELLKPKAKEVGLAEDELQRICTSVGRYEPAKADGQGESVDTFLADAQKVEWICEPIIAKNSIGFVAGLPEAKKTWLLMDLAIEMARGGGMWLKKFPVSGGKVLFIDQERAKSETQRRIKAVIAGKEINAADLKGNLFVRCGSSTKLDLQHSYDAFRKELGDIKPDIVMVDSFATFHTKEESNRMEIQQVLERIKKLRDEFGCTFLLVHHETKASYQNRKDGGTPSYLDMSGNVAIPAAAEMTLSVVQHDDEKSMVHHTKSTLSVKIAPFLVKVIDLLPDRSKIAVEAY